MRTNEAGIEVSGGFWTMVLLSSREHSESERTLSFLFQTLSYRDVSPELLQGSHSMPRGAANPQRRQTLENMH